MQKIKCEYLLPITMQVFHQIRQYISQFQIDAVTEPPHSTKMYEDEEMEGKPKPVRVRIQSILPDTGCL